jgi:mono/diheme cytochrome c family protein
MGHLRRHLPSMVFVLVLLFVVSALSGGFVYSGLYNIGADAPHSRIVFSLLQELRDKAIARGARSVAVPADLGDPKRASAGAGLYQEMCTSCHLGPGIEPSEISQGIYPSAPHLARSNLSAAEQFWTIKHGVKLSAMPAWGRTHSDELIWGMVAFIRKLPQMSPEQYKKLVASAPEDHDEMMKGMMSGGPQRNTRSERHTHPMPALTDQRH